MNNLSNEELVQVHATAREALLPVVWTEKKALAHFKSKITPGVVEAMARELLALREAQGKRKLFTCSCCGAEGLDEPLESKCHCCIDGAEWVESALYAAPQLPAVPELVPVPDEFLSAEKNQHGMFELGEDCMVRLASALAQQSKGLVVPPGWVMVPDEPTEDMCFAPDVRVGNLTWDGHQSLADMHECREIYSAMIAAAPKPESDNG